MTKYRLAKRLPDAAGAAERRRMSNGKIQKQENTLLVNNSPVYFKFPSYIQMKETSSNPKQDK